jgi:hypothetical protein
LIFSPQRDERHAYLGDASLTVDEALYNFDLIKFYHNFLNLITDVQRDDGALPNFVPGTIYPADPNWGTALLTIPRHIYRHYNDVQTLIDYYNPMVAYIKYLHGVYNTTGLANFTVRYEGEGEGVRVRVKGTHRHVSHWEIEGESKTHTRHF